MAKFQHKLALAAVISFCGLGAIAASPAHSATLMLGLKENLQNYYLVSKQDRKNNIASPSQTASPSQAVRKKFIAEDINQNIEERYQGLVEDDGEKIGLLASHKLLQSQGLLTEATPEDIEQTVALLRSEDILSEESSPNHLPKSLLYSLIALIAICAVPMFRFLGRSYIWGEEGIIENFRNKYGQPKISESTVFLHNRAFKELENFARQAEKIDNKKFGSEEFLLFYKIKQAIKQESQEYKKLGYSGELLRIAIAAQSSFLKIEQTELRFRSYKQQEFYRFVEDSLSQDIDKNRFRDLAEKKLAEIVPLLNTEEGKQALQGYLKEIKIISEHELGLKLLSLFKKYQLADYAILKRVSDITSQLEGRDLLASKNLVVLVIENYEVFEKLGPIIGIPEAESSPDVYAKLLQYIGLNYRYQDSFAKFEQLLNILKKWQKPYQTIVALRQEYNSSNYRLPKEFFQPIPGLNIYKKYEKYGLSRLCGDRQN